MNFLVNESWANTNPFLQTFCEPGTKLYQVVELSLNGPLWHLDVLKTQDVLESEQCWRRFLFGKVDHVVAQVNEQQGCKFKLSLQSTTDGQRDQEYTIRKVKQIIAATTPDGGKAYVVVFFDGTRIMQSTSGCLEEDLLHKHCVYDCVNIDADETVVS